MIKRKQSWQAQEIQKLKILYFMGATDEDSSKVLGRTPQSINKKITRLKLRPKNTETHIVKPGCYIPCFATRHDLLKSMQQVLQNLDTKEEQQYLLKKYPLQKIRKTHSLKRDKEAKAALKEKGQWRTLEEITDFLKKNKHKLESLDKQSTGYSYLLNGKPSEIQDLLIEVNKSRRRFHKPPVYLENLTES